MKRSPASCGRRQRGFTLIELLTVIAIIGVLAGMILPAITRAKVSARVAVAKKDLQMIMGAVNQYQATYNRMPASPRTRSAISDNCPDFTYGTVLVDQGGNPLPGSTLWNSRGEPLIPILNQGGSTAWQYNNSELVAILTVRSVSGSVDRFPDTRPTVNNPPHSLNPQKHNFLGEVKLKSYARPPSAGGPALYAPDGIGPDGVMRDPWGNPYIVTLDLNQDGRCRDAFYRLTSVSQEAGDRGFFGARRAAPVGPGDTSADRFEVNGDVIAWSLGPDGKASAQQRANQGFNRDNVLSWK